MRRPLGLLLVAVIVVVGWRPTALVRASSLHASPSPAEGARGRADQDSVLWVEMRNVDLHINPTSAMHVKSLRGQVITTTPGTIAWLDQPTSFHVRATSGVIALDGEAITALLNDVAFNYPGAPIKKLRVTIEDGSVVQRGVLHKGVDIPFTMWANPVLMADGRLMLQPHRMTIFGVNGITLMRALGLHLDDMMDLSKARAVSVKGDDLYLEPLLLVPPPTVEGKLTSVRIEGALMIQEFAKTADDTVFGTFVKPDSGSHNFIYFRGGSLRFGRLTMSDTDLLIHDADESDAFDLYFPEYNKQLVAGHTRNLANYGLRTWMVDYGKLRTVASAKPLVVLR